MFDPDSAIAFRTYTNYVHAWKVHTTTVRPDHHSLQTLQAATNAGQLSETVRSHLWRGELTLRLMTTPPPASFSRIAPIAALWVPVQAYYAVHGLGSAALLAVGQSLPQNHTAFRKAMAQLIRQFFSPDLAVIFQVQPNAGTQRSFRHLSLSMDQCRAQSHLETVTELNCGSIVGKSLLTTYDASIEEKLTEQRRRLPSGRSRLSPGTRATVESQAAAVSVIDFLWRMRIRSNYEDPKMFVHAAWEPESAVSFCKDLTTLTERVCAELKLIVQRRIGAASLDALVASVS